MAQAVKQRRKYRNLGGGTVAWVHRTGDPDPDAGTYACICGIDEPGTPAEAEAHAGRCRAF